MMLGKQRTALCRQGPGVVRKSGPASATSHRSVPCFGDLSEPQSRALRNDSFALPTRDTGSTLFFGGSEPGNVSIAAAPARNPIQSSARTTPGRISSETRGGRDKRISRWHAS